MRKAAFCTCKNKVADQLRVNHAADQHLCFCIIDSTMPLLLKSKIFNPLAIMKLLLYSPVCVGPGNLEVRFCHDAAHICAQTD